MPDAPLCANTPGSRFQTLATSVLSLIVVVVVVASAGSEQSSIPSCERHTCQVIDHHTAGNRRPRRRVLHPEQGPRCRCRVELYVDLHAVLSSLDRAVNHRAGTCGRKYVVDRSL
jgi:hypothetical protein